MGGWRLICGSAESRGPYNISVDTRFLISVLFQQGLSAIWIEADDKLVLVEPGKVGYLGTFRQGFMSSFKTGESNCTLMCNWPIMAK